MRAIISFIVIACIVILVVLGMYHFLGLQVGSFVDWLVGILSFLWLLIIVTVPWNAHFRAREILDEAEISKRKNILVVESSLDYVRKVVRRSLIIAISLHIASAIGLLIIALSGVSVVGYFAAGAALALTLLRPAVRFYEYLQTKLNSIREEFHYPRQDVDTLLNEVREIANKVKNLEELLTDEADKSSWRNHVDKFNADANKKLERIFQKLEANNQLILDKDREWNRELKSQVEQVRQEHQSIMTRITTDSQVLDSIRTIAGFLKKM